MTDQLHATSGEPTVHPAGWYPDAEVPGGQRYWNGATWTDERRPTPAPEAFAAQEAPTQRRRRLPAWGIVAIVIGSIVALAGLVIFGIIIAGGVKAVTDASSGGSGEPLDATVPPEWATVEVADGAASIAYDGSWEDIADYIGADQLEQQAAEESGVDLSIDGAFLISGDLVNGGVSTMIYSVPDVGGPSSARIEARAFLQGATMGVADVEVTDERAITTATGIDGHIIEFEFPMYDLVVTGAVGVLVDGTSQVMVQTSGTDTLGSGIDSLESMLNSVTFD